MMPIPTDPARLPDSLRPDGIAPNPAGQSGSILFAELDQLDAGLVASRQSSGQSVILSTPRNRDADEQIEQLLRAKPRIDEAINQWGVRFPIRSLIVRLPESLMNTDVDDSIEEIVSNVLQYAESQFPAPLTIYFDQLISHLYDLQVGYTLATLAYHLLNVRRAGYYSNIDGIGFCLDEGSLCDGQAFDIPMIAQVLDRSIREEVPLYIRRHHWQVVTTPGSGPGILNLHAAHQLRTAGIIDAAGQLIDILETTEKKRFAIGDDGLAFDGQKTPLHNESDRTKPTLRLGTTFPDSGGRAGK